MEQLQKVNSEKDISSAQALAELLKELARGEKSAEKQGYISLQTQKICFAAFLWKAKQY